MGRPAGALRDGPRLVDGQLRLGHAPGRRAPQGRRHYAHPGVARQHPEQGAERDDGPTAIADDLGISEHALQRDLAGIFAKLDLPYGAVGHRRVLAVLTYIRAEDAG